MTVGLLFIFLAGITVIILIARLASKTRPKGERVLEEGGGPYRNGGDLPHSKPVQERFIAEGLISLLIKKGMITEEELLSEVELIKKIKEEN